MMELPLTHLAQQWLLAAKTGADPRPYRAALAQAPATALAQLATDADKKAFWVNVYNALVISELSPNPALFAARNRFFATPRLAIAGRNLSLDQIEHGLLRRSAWKYSLGYWHHPWPGRFFRQHAVARLDARIHFALNCGAASCPPIRFYQPENLEAQFDLATAAYLTTQVRCQANPPVLWLPRLLWWFQGDFGGRPGIARLLAQHGLPPPSDARWRYQPYSWDLHLGQFT